SDLQVQTEERRRDGEADPPPGRGALDAGQDRGVDGVVDLPVRLPGRDDAVRLLHAAACDLARRDGHQWAPSWAPPPASDGCGFLTLARYVVRGNVCSSSSKP